MKLIKAKIRGLGTAPETDWFKLGPKLNLIDVADRSARTALLKALQTIQPPYDCDSAEPFADYPTCIEHHGYTRKITPSKRTIAIAVFSSSPQLVHKLASITPLLYETDRIEIGRRLDYSRWVNFIEIAPSTRWSEISDEMNKMIARWQKTFPPDGELKQLVTGLEPTDRVTGTVMKTLQKWLENLLEEIPADNRSGAEELLNAVKRAEYFRNARTLIKERAPLFAIIDAGDPSPGRINVTEQESTGTTSALDHLIKEFDRQINLDDDDKGTDHHTLLDDLHHELDRFDFLDQTVRVRHSQSVYDITCESDRRARQKLVELEPLSFLKAASGLTIAASRVLLGREPILLFDAPDRAVPDESSGDLADTIRKISTQCQCLCAPEKCSLFPVGDDTVSLYGDDIIV